MLLTQCSD